MSGMMTKLSLGDLVKRDHHKTRVLSGLMEAADVGIVTEIDHTFAEATYGVMWSSMSTSMWTTRAYRRSHLERLQSLQNGCDGE